MRYRRRRKYQQRVKPGDMIIQLKRIRTVKVNSQNNEYIGLNFTAKDFPELQPFLTQFEAFQFQRYAVKVIPSMNVSNNSTSRIGTYCLVPWHKKTTKPTNYSSMLSIDKSRVYRGTQTAYRSFVPAVHVQAETTGTGNAAAVIKWKPRIDIVDLYNDVEFYCGMIGIQGIPDATENVNYYHVVEYVTCKLINQNYLNDKAVRARELEESFSEAFEAI